MASVQRSVCSILLGLFAIAPGVARAQTPSTTSSASAGIRAPASSVPAVSPAPANATAEQILGYSAARNVMVYVERTPSGLAGFTHATLVEVQRGGTAPPRRIRLSTDTDVAQLRGASGATRESARAAIEARIARDVASARAGLIALTVIPVRPRGFAPTGPRACQNSPFAAREFDVGSELTARALPSSDGARTTVTLSQSGRAGPAIEVPSTVVSSGSVTVSAPYDVVADVREVPGTDSYAVLLRSDACTPEGVTVVARAELVPAPPPPERALMPLNHAELDEIAVMRVLAPRARRRTVDEVQGWYEGRARVVFDNAWQLDPVGGQERVLVQFTRRSPDLSPLLGEAGQAPASYALMSREGARLRLLSQFTPPASENAFEGTGQEAFAADLDGDGTNEVIVRARYNRDDEVATIVRTASDSVQFVWRGQTRIDERVQPAGPRAEVRRCELGMDGRLLVVRCAVETHRVGAAPDASLEGRARLIQRVRWNGGVVEVQQERR